MSPGSLLALALLLPAVTAVLVAACRRRPNLRETMSLLGAGSSFAVTVLLLRLVAAGQTPALQIAEPLPGAAIEFGLEPFGALFACLATLLWIVTTIYSIGYMRGHGERHQTRFYCCFALALAAVLVVAAAGNLLTLFIGYELLTLSTYPLVTHAGSEPARRGGRIYLGILLTTSICLLLPAIVWTHSIAGHGTFTAGGLLAGAIEDGRLGKGAAAALFALFGLGIGKAALMPFHLWLPAAMVAPTPVSALLHAVAVVKAGVFTLLKVVVYVFGAEPLRAIGAATPIAWVAGVTMLLASAVALRKDNLKARLAWSTIAQLAYIIAGATTATAAGIVGAGLHMVTHAFGKITLFFGAGALLVAAHVTNVSGVHGLGRRMPVTFAAFAVASLGIVGLPPMGGLWSKWWLGLGMAEAERPFLLLLLLSSSLLSAGYLLPITVRAFGPAPPTAGAGGEAQDGHDNGHEHGDAPWQCRLALVVTASACIATFFLLEPLQQLLQRAVP